MNPSLLDLSEVHLSLSNVAGSLHLLKGVSFSIAPGEIVGLVGESGCGKSLTASAILGILPSNFQLTGSILFEGEPLPFHSPRELACLRGNRLGLILQDPAQALNPLITIGTQLIEGLRYHKKLSRKAAFAKGVEWLARVGISDAEQRMGQYPHQLSGGMKQRILIAMALICQPSLLIADEPTTALDLTVQMQILDLLQQLQREEQMSILLITHDLGVVARCCSRVMVMYAGQVVESGSVEQMLISPQHPYTKVLLESKKSLERL